ncbi:MAG: hypothetical protein JM58_18150 [Peptococcaceae bacterium BICA1-8]|nr:MAG: hypothetical protein JM58_18150 [Peptococcaceae bacterium BICA1-8]
MFNLVIAGAVSGIIAGIVMGLISMALSAVKICKLCLIAIGGGLFTGQLMDEFNGYGIILSWFIHLALSGALGILIVLMLHYFGTKYHILKGAGLLTLVYLANIGVIAPLRGVFPDNQEFFDLLLILLYHILFGGLASFLIVKYKNKIAA